MKSLKRNSIYNIIYTLSNLLFPMIISMIVSRVINPEGIGKVSFAQNVASYFLMTAQLGMSAYGIREIAKVNGDENHTNKIFTELFLINFITTMISSLAYVLLIFINRNFKENILLYLSCGLQILFNIINIDWFYSGKEEYGYIAIRNIIVKIASLVAIIFFVRSEGDFVIYALITSIAAGANYVFNIIHVRKYVKFTWNGLSFRGHLKPLIVLGISSFMSLIYSKVDVTMIGIMSNDFETGIYSNAHKIINMLITACTAICTVFFPRLSFLYENDKNKFYLLLEKGIKILSFIVFPASIGVCVLSPYIMETFYGKAFMDGSVILQVFSFLIIIKGIGNLLCYQLVICTNNEKKRLPIYFIATIINVIMNSFLIPKIGGLGAAIASVTSEFLVNFFLLIWMFKILRFNIPFKAIVQNIISSLLMGMIIYFFVQLKLSTIMLCVLGTIIGGVLYLILNLIFRNEIIMNMISSIKEKLK